MQSMRCARFFIPCLGALLLGVIASADDKSDAKEKKAKAAKLTAIGYLDGEITYADEGSEKLVVKVKELKQVWVPNPYPAYGNFNRLNQLGLSGSVGLQEQSKEYSLVYSPDLKVRLMNTNPAAGKKENKKASSKEKDPDAKLGGTLGKKESLAKGQVVRVFVGRAAQDRLNQQNYAMVVYVISEGK